MEPLISIAPLISVQSNAKYKLDANGRRITCLTGTPYERLYDFAKNLLGYDLITIMPHAEMCEFLEAAVEPMFWPNRPKDTLKSMLAVPRGCFKTTIGSIALVLWLVVQFPEITILITTHTHAYSKEILSEIKFHMENGEAFKNLFGELWQDSPRWAEDAIIVNTRRTARKEPTIGTAGVDAAKTGGHYDVIVADDLITEKTAETKGGFNKVRRHIRTLIPILNRDGCELFTFTRWAFNDVYGAMIEADEKRVRDGNKPQYRKLIRGAWLSDGTLYAPTILPQATLDKLRYHSDLTEKEFAVWYLNEPMEEGSKVFPRSIIGWFKGKYVFDREPFILLETPLGTMTVPVYVTMAIDPAFSTSVAADFTGFTIVGTGPDGTMYVMCADAFKGPPDAVVDHAIALALKFKPRILSIEAVAAQVLFKPLLVPKMREAGLGATQLYEYKQSMRRSKAQRIEAMQPRFKQNMIRLAEGLGELADQLNRYPELDHDDLIDSLAQHMELSRPPRRGEVHPAVGRDWFEEVKHWSLEDKPMGGRTAPATGGYGGRHSTNMPGLTSERPPDYT